MVSNLLLNRQERIFSLNVDDVITFLEYRSLELMKVKEIDISEKLYKNLQYLENFQATVFYI